MKSPKQVKSKFLRLSAKAIKLNNTFVRLKPEEKVGKRGRALLEALSDTVSEQKMCYWVLDMHPDTHTKKKKQAKKKKNDRP